MKAFPDPIPNEPRILQLTKSPEDRLLAIAVLVYGKDNVPALAAFTTTPDESVKKRLASIEFQAFLQHLKNKPEEVLPGKAEVFARLAFEMIKGDRTTDRLRAAEMLLEIQGQQPKDGVLEKYSRKGNSA